MSIQRRNSELVDLLRPDFVGNDGTASPTFTDEYLTGSHRQSVSVGVRVERDADFVHNNTGGWLAIPFTHQRWDDPDDDQWAIGTPTRLTCRIAGTYVISGHIFWDGNAVGQRGISIYLNGTTLLAVQDEQGLTADGFAQSIATVYKLSVGDFLEFLAFQGSGGNLNVIMMNNWSPEFAMVRAA